MTNWEVERNSQKATLLEDAPIDLSVYNLANFTKHVFFKVNAFFRMTYCRTNRNCQKATLLEEAKINSSVYNLVNFTKHVFAKKYSKSKRYSVQLILGPKKATLLDEGKIKVSLSHLCIVSTFLPRTCWDIFGQLRRFRTLQPSREGLYGVRIT